MSDLISREELKKHKFIVQICNGVEIEDVEVVPVANINNAPTVVDCKNCDGYEAGYSAGMRDTERPQCENCDFRKFTEKFTEGFVEGLNKYGITSVEQLSEMLKGGEE